MLGSFPVQHTPSWSCFAYNRPTVYHEFSPHIYNYCRSYHPMKKKKMMWVVCHMSRTDTQSTSGIIRLKWAPNRPNIVYLLVQVVLENMSDEYVPKVFRLETDGVFYHQSSSYVRDSGSFFIKCILWILLNKVKTKYPHV